MSLHRGITLDRLKMLEYRMRRCHGLIKSPTIDEVKLPTYLTPAMISCIVVLQADESVFRQARYENSWHQHNRKEISRRLFLSAENKRGQKSSLNKTDNLTQPLLIPPHYSTLPPLSPHHLPPSQTRVSFPSIPSCTLESLPQPESLMHMTQPCSEQTEEL